MSEYQNRYRLMICWYGNNDAYIKYFPDIESAKNFAKWYLNRHSKPSYYFIQDTGIVFAAGCEDPSEDLIFQFPLSFPRPKEGLHEDLLQSLYY